MQQIIKPSYEVFQKIKCSNVGKGLLSKLDNKISKEQLTEKCNGTIKFEVEIIEDQEIDLCKDCDFFCGANKKDLSHHERKKREIASPTEAYPKKTFQQELFDKLGKLVGVMASIKRDQIVNSAYEPKNDPFKYKIDNETRLCQKAINVTLRRLQAANLTTTDENLFVYFNVTGESE